MDGPSYERDLFTFRYRPRADDPLDGLTVTGCGVQGRAWTHVGAPGMVDVLLLDHADTVMAMRWFADTAAGREVPARRDVNAAGRGRYLSLDPTGDGGLVATVHGPGRSVEVVVDADRTVRLAEALDEREGQVAPSAAVRLNLESRTRYHETYEHFAFPEHGAPTGRGTVEGDDVGHRELLLTDDGAEYRGGFRTDQGMLSGPVESYGRGGALDVEHGVRVWFGALHGHSVLPSVEDVLRLRRGLVRALVRGGPGSESVEVACEETGTWLTLAFGDDGAEAVLHRPEISVRLLLDDVQAAYAVTRLVARAEVADAANTGGDPFVNAG